MKLGSHPWIPLLCLTGGVTVLADTPQNPSPMVEHTRAHPRLKEEHPPGKRHDLEPGKLFIPEALDSQSQPSPRPLLIFFHGGAWLPEVTAAKNGHVVITFQSSAKAGWSYLDIFKDEDRFTRLIAGAETAAGGPLRPITLGGWSAGCQAVRELLRDPAIAARVDRALFIDGIHASYTHGKPGPLESALETAALAPIVAFAREAMAGRKRLLITHTEIFPGTFASTTETADWLLRELGVPRRAVLEWGPMQTQQLSLATEKGFSLRGFAGNSAPDHVDLLHALPDWLAEKP